MKLSLSSISYRRNPRAPPPARRRPANRPCCVRRCSRESSTQTGLSCGAGSSLPSPSRAQLPHAPVVRASSLPPSLFPSLPKCCVPSFLPPPNPADSAPQTPAEARLLRANCVIFFAEKRQDLIRELWLAKGSTRRHIQTRDGVPPFRYLPEHVNFATTVATLFFYQPKLQE